MGRNRKTHLDAIIDISSRLSWKINIPLAAISYVVLHMVAQIKLQPPAGAGELGSYTVKQIYITMAIFGQVLLPGVFLIAALVSFIRTRKHEQLYNGVVRRQEVGVLTSMGWREFEQLIGEYFRRHGYKVFPTDNGADGGIDIKLMMNNETYLVQCKQWRAYKVGVQPVREFYGVMAASGAAGGFVVTSGEFTAEAISFADGLNVRLINGQQLLHMFNELQKSVPKVITTNPTVNVSATPECPSCGKKMTKRIARKGANVGKAFWGCSEYPHCNGVRALEN